MQKKFALILSLGVYLISSLSTYAVFAYILNPEPTPIVTQSPDEETAISSLINIDPGEPKDQVCPLNGALFTKTEKDAWEKKRPLAVMIENTPDARPQSGMSQADVVYEAVAEGGVTRFLGLFYCNVQKYDTLLAPVRSARTYFIDYASGYNYPLYVHVGGANEPGPTNALGQLGDYGWVGENDLNQFSIGYPTFYRDYNRVEGKEIATEHTMVTSTEKLWKYADDERGWTNMSPDTKVKGKVVPGEDWKAGYKGWKYEDSESAAGTVSKIAYEFWSGYDDYAVEWTYDSASDTYSRKHGGENHTDLNNGQQVAAKNVVVLLTTEKGPINDKKHMLYGTTGTGEALLFKHGQVTKGTWSKKTRESELTFADDKGKEYLFAPGMTWISILEKTTDVKY